MQGRKIWHAAVHGVERSRTRLSEWTAGTAASIMFIFQHRAPKPESSGLCFPIVCLGEGIGTPLQCPCLENPMDGGAWWAAVHGVATEWLRFHFSLSCVGEGNGNPLQGSCLENPRDGGAWWASVYGAAQSCTRLKRLSSSSSSIVCPLKDLNLS